MIVTGWIVVTRNGSMRFTKRRPTVPKRSEVAVKVEIDVPDALFREPVLTAHLTIDPRTVATVEVPVAITDAYVTVEAPAGPDEGIVEA